MLKVIDVIIPAFNEENAVGKVVNAIPKNLVRDIIVVDNNSSDQTCKQASSAGAIVLKQHIQGYGAACLKGMDFIHGKTIKPNIIVFLDADYSDHPEELPQLVEPIIEESADMVIGSRSLGNREKGSMTFPQRFGNRLATVLLKLIYGYKFTDLGPFRAIRYDRLVELGMSDMNYGWTIEMQIKAAKRNLTCVEVPVKYRVRIGESKVSGTVKGAFLAGYKIILTLFRYA
ncbi:MAG: glycosyltransferase family 2 protein [Salibacteraceae bacterium]